MAPTTIRVRLTAWYGVVLTVTLVALGAAVYLLMARALVERVDAILDFEFREAAERLAARKPAAEPAEGPTAFHETFLLRVLDASGRVLSESGELAGRRLAFPPPRDAAPGRLHTTLTLGAL